MKPTFIAKTTFVAIILLVINPTFELDGDDLNGNKNSNSEENNNQKASFLKKNYYWQCLILKDTKKYICVR